MNKPVIRRLIWAYVAACAAWRLYPEEVTVIPNKALGIETCDQHGYVRPCFICRVSAQPQPQTQIDGSVNPDSCPECNGASRDAQGIESRFRYGTCGTKKS